MALAKGTLSRFVWKMRFYKGLNKKSFLLEALTVSDLQRSLEAQALKICLLKLFAVKHIKEGCSEPLEAQEVVHNSQFSMIGTHGPGKGNPF